MSLGRYIAAILLYVVAYDRCMAQDTVETVIVRPCPHIEIHGSLDVPLSKQAIDLICGSDKVKEWEKVPFYQAEYLLRGFLQEQGFLRAKSRVENEKLIVETGPIVRVREILVESDVDTSHLDRYWYPVGRPLTPQLLDRITDFSQTSLSERGYPCANVTLHANPETGIITVTIKAGERFIVQQIDSDDIDFVLSNIDRRYDAFEIGERFDSQKLEITSRRLVASGMVLNSSFSPQCGSPAKGVVNHRIIPGEPRMLSFGFGFDTEEYAIARFDWSHGRLGDTASIFQTHAYISYVRQEAGVAFDWYYLPFMSRHFLRTDFQIGREEERRYSESQTTSTIAPVWVTDFSGSRLETSFGVKGRYSRLYEGLGKEEVRLVTLLLRGDLASHDYEYYLGSPRHGYTSGMTYEIGSVDAGSNVSLQRITFDGTRLWSLGRYLPPIYILGLRTKFRMTRPDKETALQDLPPSFRQYMGGTADMRGFGRRSLPPNDLGAYGMWHLGSELRVNHILPYELQPFVFADLGWLGEEAAKIDFKTTYWSPGLGLRWESPIGAIRTTMAHGLIAGEKEQELDYLSRWQFYFSFGESF